MRLAVELYGTRIGMLDGDSRTFDFVASSEALERFGVNAPTLSVAIPFTFTPRRDHASRRRNWFSELLPEGDQYEYMLAQGKLKRGDTLGFLARYGRDIAGAVQLWDIDDPTEPKSPSLVALTDEEVRGILEDPMGSPLANSPISGKSSLGGVQPKAVLARTSEGWCQALGGHPTTHIVKPQLSGDLASVIFDEEYGTRIARRFGVTNFASTVTTFDGLHALVIERFDRDGTGRIHQEDFNQALGAQGNEKYQELGGVVTLRRVAHVVTQHASPHDLRMLARMVVLSVAVGNLDMHTKNIGLLHPADGAIRLAPAYDVVPQRHMPNDGKLALAVNNKYDHRAVTGADLVAEFTSWKLGGSEKLVATCLDELTEIVASETPLDGAYPSLQDDITQFLNHLR